MHPVPLRAFGQSGDLDLDLGQPDRPALVTALLARCSEDADPAFWWSQPVCVRTMALLRIADTGGSIGFTARCASEACGVAFEFLLPMDRLEACADPAPLRVALGAGRTLAVRRPTGSDLRAWRALQADPGPDPVHAMLAGLVTDGVFGPGDSGALAEALAAGDPLVAFEVDAECPDCGARQPVAIDLESHALARLARRQRALLREVHTLALHYGWSEGESLALPAVRRAGYLAMIEGER